MSRPAFALAALLALVSCERTTPPAPPPAEQAQDVPPEARLETDNLLNLVYGASIVDRSGELSYESSAAHAIDGSAYTIWSSAPGGKMNAVLSLGAPAHLRKIGAFVAPNKDVTPERISVDASLDSKTWRNVVDEPLAYDKKEPQLFDADVEARYLRFHFTEPHDYYSHIPSLYAVGRETAPAAQAPLEGCWEVNMTEPARFERRGARVFGNIGGMIVDGGATGRFYRLMWRERMQWGYAAVSVAADGQTFSGIRWHEEVNHARAGDGWFGRRVSCAPAAPHDGARIVDAMIARAALWQMYGVRFDARGRILEAESKDALDLAAQLVRTHPKHRFRIIAREFREPAAEKNRAASAAMLAAVRQALRTRGADLARIEFSSAGSDRDPQHPDTTAQRVMDSGVELQVLPLE